MAISPALTSSASAPGKVILFGDHAVVYGRSAVAASVSDLRVQVDASLTESGQVVIHFVDLLRNVDQKPLKYITSIESIHQALGFLGDENALSIQGSMESRTPDVEAVQKVIAFPTLHGECSGGEDLSPSESKAIMSSIYLTASIALPFLYERNMKQQYGLYLEVSSKGLPVGAGLGSSAALSVATSAALLRLSAVINNNLTGKVMKVKQDEIENIENLFQNGEENAIPPPNWLQCINEWAFAAEVVMTGTPSGIDNTVSCFGKAVRYRRGLNGEAPQINILNNFSDLKILLTDTRVARETKVLVAKVRSLRSSSKSMEKVIDSIFDSIENVTECFLTTVEEKEKDGTTIRESTLTTRAYTLQHLVRINQELLCSIGVGHPSLDRVCQLARAAGFETKLTGAGGGGCAFTLLEPRECLEKKSVDSDTAQLVESLEGSEGYRCYKSRIAGAGVLWLSPSSSPSVANSSITKTVQNAKTDLKQNIILCAFVLSNAFILRHWLRG